MVWFKYLLCLLVAVPAILLAFPLVPIAVARAKATGAVRPFVEEIKPEWMGNEDLHTIPDPYPLYRLPWWARWLETPDELDGLLPGGLYEEDIRKVFVVDGWQAAARAWLWRNKAYRLMFWLGAQSVLGKPRGDIVDAYWEMLKRGERLVLPTQSGKVLSLRMYGAGDVDDEHTSTVEYNAGEWTGTIEQVSQIYPEHGVKRFICRRWIGPVIFGRSVWMTLGWSLDPYFDAIRDRLPWPDGMRSAAGKLALPWPRFERVATPPKPPERT